MILRATAKMKKGIIALAIFLVPIVAQGATYIVGGAPTTVTVGQEVELKFGIDTEGEKVNVLEVHAVLPNGITFVRFVQDQSAVNLWVKGPEYNKEDRAVSFVGGVPGGLAGTVVLLGVVVKAEKPGTYTIGITKESQAYLNDGLGTPAPLRFQDTMIAVPGHVQYLPWWGWVAVGIGILGIIIWSIRYRKRAKSIT